MLYFRTCSVLFYYCNKKMDLEDLEYFCTLYQSTQRDDDALEILKRIIEMDPVFDKKRRYLFQLVYKSIVDALRDCLRLYKQYFDIERSSGRQEMCKELEKQEQELIDQLIPRCKEGITTITNILLPNAESADAQIFYLKFKADLYRYISEFSDQTEALSALKQAEDLYTQAIAIADENLSKSDPTYLGVILNASVFQYEHRKNVSEAFAMCDSTLAQINESFQDLTPEQQEETNNLVKIMRRNLATWATEAEEDEDDEVDQ